MKLTCMTSPLNRACRFLETNSLKAWTDYSFTLVSDTLRDYDGCSATAVVTSLDQEKVYATCTLREDPIQQCRDRRYGVLLLTGTALDALYKDLCEEAGSAGLVKTLLRLTITIHPSLTVLVDTDVPVVLCAAPEDRAT